MNMAKGSFKWVMTGFEDPQEGNIEERILKKKKSLQPTHFLLHWEHRPVQRQVNPINPACWWQPLITQEGVGGNACTVVGF